MRQHALTCGVFLVCVLGLVDPTDAQRAPVETVRFFAESVAREMTYNIILPSGYEDEANRDQLYPTLYLLHGYGNNLSGLGPLHGDTDICTGIRPDHRDAGRRELVLRELGTDGRRPRSCLGGLPDHGISSVMSKLTTGRCRNVEGVPLLASRWGVTAR